MLILEIEIFGQIFENLKYQQRRVLPNDRISRRCPRKYLREKIDLEITIFVLFRFILNYYYYEKKYNYRYLYIIMHLLLFL